MVALTICQKRPSFFIATRREGLGPRDSVEDCIIFAILCLPLHLVLSAARRRLCQPNIATVYTSRSVAIAMRMVRRVVARVHVHSLVMLIRSGAFNYYPTVLNGASRGLVDWILEKHRHIAVLHRFYCESPDATRKVLTTSQSIMVLCFSSVVVNCDPHM